MRNFGWLRRKWNDLVTKGVYHIEAQGEALHPTHLAWANRLKKLAWNYVGMLSWSRCNRCGKRYTTVPDPVAGTFYPFCSLKCHLSASDKE